jgi:hypothetical protein
LKCFPGQIEVRVPGHFPEKTVRVREVAAVTAPEYVPRRLDDFCPSALGLLKSSVNFFFRANIVRQAKSWEDVAWMFRLFRLITGVFD